MLQNRQPVAGLYTACGFAFGCLFPLVAIPLDAYFEAGSVSASSMAMVWAQNPLLWIIATAPAFLGLFASRAGRHQDSISALVDERDETIRQQTAELKEALVASHAADAAKSAFLASMSHEIRTPMNAVIGVAELLRGTNLDPDQLSFVKTIQTSGESLLVIINDILDFSKIEAGEMELDHRPFDLSDCVSSVLELLGTAAADKGLELAYIEDPEILTLIYGDQMRMRQVVLNLVGNAIKFTESGEVVVTVASEQIAPNTPDEAEVDADSVSAERRRITVAVHDTGIGIDPDKIDELFQSFSQVDTSSTRRFAGTGLGLAISRQLIEMMGGDITVSSRGLGHGSTFSFTVDFDVHASKSAVAEILADRSVAGLRVLIVDDNATNREILLAQTSQWGMHPVAFDSAGPALRSVEQGTPFDIAILDMHMPDVDGLTLAGRLRDHFASVGSDFPLLLLSSGHMTSDANLRSVFDDILLKPARGERLHGALSELAGSQPLMSRPNPPAQSEPADDEASADQSHEDGTGAATAVPADKDDGLRILLVEDNIVNQKVALAMLARLGYEADVAHDGLAALDAIAEAEARFDVVMMDVQMPALDGLATTQRIRAELPANRQPHIIAMTANAMRQDREACLDAGMDDYIAKPVRLEDLAGALARLSLETAR